MQIILNKINFLSYFGKQDQLICEISGGKGPKSFYESYDRQFPLIIADNLFIVSCSLNIC